MSNDHSQKSEEAKGSLINAAESSDFLRQQIRELHEKLIFANETIAIMEDQREAKDQKVSVQPLQSEEEDEEKLRDEASDGEDEEPSAKRVGLMIRKVQGSFVGSSNSNPVMDQVEMLQQKIDCLEIQNSELENEIDTSKVKAKELLMKKDLQERRIKIIIQKLESHMKNSNGMTQEEINQVGQLTEDELQLLYEMESEI